jgi:hypothetical protein
MPATQAIAESLSPIPFRLKKGKERKKKKNFKTKGG